MSHKPWKTNKQEQEFNVENGLRVSRIIAVSAVLLVLALAGCLVFTILWYVWEYVVLNR